MRRDFFKELGVRPFINAAGTFTKLTASLMPPEVLEAMDYAARHYVRLSDLQDAVGGRIASLIHAEAAMVTAGAASALTLGTAACITGMNPDLIHRLPDLAGMKSEVIVQQDHRDNYNHAIRACGVKLIEVQTPADVGRVVNERTAMMAFFNLHEPEGRIKAPEFAALAKRHRVPALNDIAADVPPAENLWKFTAMGFDLVAISGGKGLRGPQSSGLLFGRRDLIEAAKLNASPNSDTIGRGMKVNKEEMVGMLVAVELYLKRDHAADGREWAQRCATIAGALRALDGVSTEVWVPEIANHTPHLRVRWKGGLTVEQVMQKLREGEPSIEANPDSSDELIIAVWMMEPGDAAVVGRRLSEILTAEKHG